MALNSKYSKIFLGLIIYQLSFIAVPFALSSFVSDANSILIITSIVAIIPVFLAMGKDNFFKELVEKRESVSVLFFILLILAPTGTNIIGGFFESTIKSLLGLSVPATVSEMTEEISQTPTFAVAFYTCIMAPLSEELVFRNSVYRTIENKRPWVAVVVAGILFSLMHTNLDQTLGNIPTAIYFTYLAFRYSIIVPIFAHILNNTIFFTSAFLKSIPSISAQLVDNIFLGLAILGVIAFLIVIVSAVRYFIKNRNREPKGKVEYLKNPFFIAYVLLCIGLIILNDFVL